MANHIYETILQQHEKALARERRRMFLSDCVFELLTGIIFAGALAGGAYLLLMFLGI